MEGGKEAKNNRRNANASRLLWYMRRSGEHGFEFFFDGAFGHGADELVGHFAILEEQQRGDAADAEALCGLLRIVHIDFADFDAAFVFIRKLFNRWRNHAARATPGGPKINEYGQVRINDFRLEIVICQVQ